jgi:hypothetical protein
MNNNHQKTLMKPNNIIRIAISFFLAVVITFLCLYRFGNLGSIQVYADPTDAPASKLMFIESFMFVTMAAAVFTLLYTFLQFKRNRMILLVATTLFSFYLSASILTMGVPASRHAVGLSYILVGDYLRDVHGINVYFMDWVGWSITFTLYLTPLLSVFIYKGAQRVFAQTRINKK